MMMTIMMIMMMMMMMMMSLLAQMWSNWRTRRREQFPLLGFLTTNNSGNELIIHAFSDWMTRNSYGERYRSGYVGWGRIPEETLPRKVLSIVGPGAIALAEKLYNDTEGHFVCRAMVKMSEGSGTTAALTSILRQVSSNDRWHPGKNDDHALDKPELIKRIWQALWFKRYFIVILDIWDESEWTSIAHAFCTEFSCSGRVITTTRRKTVAETCFQGKFDFCV